MLDRSLRCSRRKFLASAAALTLSNIAPGAEDALNGDMFRARPSRPGNEGRKPLAVIATVYRPLSHAYHLVGRFLHGYTRDGRLHVPGQFVASMHVDQLPENDLSRELSREFGFRHCRSIADALTLGTDRLAVDGVVLVGEHGNYPRNDKEQILYPRSEMFGEIVEVFRRTGRAVPVFNAKHLSYSWPQAKRMAASAAELKFPLLAGSSVPLTWRRPELELPLEAPIEDALVAAYGPLEVYGFDALEALQAMMERRKGLETGIKAVQCLTGNAVWKAGDAGRWSWDLLEAALGRSETVNPGDIRRNVGSLGIGAMPKAPATAFLIEYRDGTHGTALLLNGHVQDFTVAVRLKGETKPHSCLFHLPGPPGAKHFDCQVAAMEKMFETGQAPLPLERTLLTGGALDFLMESHQRRGQQIQTPELDVHYGAPVDSGFARGGPAVPV